MKGERMSEILAILKYAAYTTDELLDTLTLGGYIGSYRKMRGLPPLKNPKPSLPISWQIASRKTEERHRFFSLISRLKKQGLVKQSRKAGKNKWLLTSMGKTKFKQLLIRLKKALPPVSKYNPKKANEWKIIVFDIPEEEKRKRNWLRLVLKHLDFDKLQRSVWIGKAALPQTFLEDLQKLNMLDYVEILAITKSGSIKQIE